MVQINFGQREVSCKLVYYGPGMSGKTTNLEIIHQKAPESARGEMVSIATETDRTLYFDFLPLDLGQVAGMHTKFQLYTVPGQVYYNATRKLVLQGVDGVIFVADSNPDKMAENIESFENLGENLAEMGLSFDAVALVIQWNKRDLPNAMPVEELERQFNPKGYPTTEAVARDGKCVFPTLKVISKLVIDRLNKEHAPATKRRRTNTGSGPTPNLGAQAAQAAPAAAPAPVPSATTPTPISPAPTALPPQPAPAAPPPAAAPAPAAAPMPAARSAQSMAAAAAPTQSMPSAKDKHLQKEPPPALGSRQGDPLNPGNIVTTDPNLKRFKDAGRPAGGGGNKFLTVLLSFIVIFIIFVLMVIFVPPVTLAIRPHLPAGLQKMLAPEETTGVEPSAPLAPAPPATSPEPTAPAADPSTVP